MWLPPKAFSQESHDGFVIVLVAIRCFCGPSKLKLDFLTVIATFVLYAEFGAGRDVNALTGHLDPERLSCLKSIREATELGYDIACGVHAFNISGFFQLKLLACHD